MYIYTVLRIRKRGFYYLRHLKCVFLHPNFPNVNFHDRLLRTRLWLCDFEDLEQETVPGTVGMHNMGKGPEWQFLRAQGPVGPGTFA